MKNALWPESAASIPERGVRARPLPRPDPAPSRLWMGLHFPRLPLEACGRGAGRAPPLAVVCDERVDSPLLVVNESARAAGLRPGMGLGSAAALVPRLEVLQRDPALEQAALEGLAAWAEQFTACISLAPPAGLLLEVGGSLRLFGAAAALRERIESGLRGLGFEVSSGTAPTPAAAWLLARAGLAEPVPERSRLPGRLAEVPLACLDLPAPALRDLEAMGVRSFREGYRLPRDAVSRRVGEALVDTMDRALGRRPDARARHSAAPAFSRRLDFPAEVEDMAPIRVALRRLLHELEAFLRARALGASGLELRLLPHLAPALRIPVSLISTSRDAGHLLDLLEKRLERVVLTRPVAALVLEVQGFEVQAPHNANLYDAGAAAPRDSLHTLIERLQSRLGRGALWRLAPVADHRPERAFSRVPPRDARAGGIESGRDTRSPRPGPLRDSRAAGGTHSAGRRVKDRASDVSPHCADTAPEPEPHRQEDRTRPLWLLEPPRCLEPENGHPRDAESGGGHREGLLSRAGRPGRLTISPHFERIESGWWDGEDVRRDYHVARGANGVRYWVYREHGTRDWFLHGIFG